MVQVDELPPEGPGGAVRFVRRHLGVGAFGINWYELPPNVEGREHDEQETQQEEVNVVIAGSGVYRVDAGPEGLTMIAVGARRGSYEPRGPF
jgi:uncharacterized cupin superfamily protein